MNLCNSLPVTCLHHGPMEEAILVQLGHGLDVWVNCPLHHGTCQLGPDPDGAVLYQPAGAALLPQLMAWK